MKLKNGDKVRFIDNQCDDTIYTVSTYNEVQVWIGDADGRGWFVFEDDLELVTNALPIP